MRLFLSHIHEESQLALCIKQWVETTFTERIEVFCSSDSIAFAQDANFLRKLLKELRKSDLLLLLASSRSLQRPWINFEAGCAWVRDLEIVPLCHSGQKRGSLPLPLALFTAIEILDPKGCEDFLNILRVRLGETRLVPVASRMADELKDAAVRDAKREREPFVHPLDGLPFALLETFCRVYQAEKMPGRLSAVADDSSASNGKARCAFVADRGNHLLFGPYEPVAKAGEYVAFFALKIGEHASLGPIALLDIVGSQYVTRQIYRGDFPRRGSYHGFALPFTIKGDESRDMEYRVLAEDRSGEIWIDFVAVCRAEELPPSLQERIT